MPQPGTARARGWSALVAADSVGTGRAWTVITIAYRLEAVASADYMAVLERRHAGSRRGGGGLGR